MAGLRDSFDVRVDDGQANLIAEQARAADMGSLAKAYAGGRVGTEINAALAEQASARAAATDVSLARANELDGTLEGLRGRQAMYAPDVGKVEDIGSRRGLASDALSWFGTQVGQGAASMQDPIAVGAAIQGAGTLGRMSGTGAGRALGAVAPFLAGAAGFGINQQQMKGEFYGNALQDQELLGRTSPQDLNRAANIQGAIGGALETVVPHVIGGQLGASILGKGAQAIGALKNPAVKAVGGAGMEGLTEVAQGETGRQILGFMNPNRNTSGDMSDRLNEFAGGMAGGALPSAVGAYTEAGYGRLNEGANRVKDAAGTVIDMAGNAATQTADTARAAAGKVLDLGQQAQGLYEGSAAQTAVGKGAEVAKNVWQRTLGKKDEVVDLLRDDESGKIDLGKAVEAAEQAFTDFRMSRDELGILDGTPPESLTNEADIMKWYDDNHVARSEFIADRLGQLADSEDATAIHLYDSIGEAQTPAEQTDAYNAAADYLRERNDYQRMVNKGAALQENLATIGGAAGRYAVKGAKTVGKFAGDLGKAIWDGASSEATKKNMQGQDAPITFNDWAKLQAYKPKGGMVRGEQMANIVAGATRDEALKAAAFPRALGYEVSEILDAFGKSKDGGRSMSAQGIARVDDVLADLSSVVGKDVQSVLAQMQQAASGDNIAAFDMLRARASALATGRAQYAAERSSKAATDDLFAKVPELAQNIGTLTPAIKEKVFGAMQAIARGQGEADQRQGIESIIGKDAFKRALDVVNGFEEKQTPAGVVPGTERAVATPEGDGYAVGSTDDTGSDTSTGDGEMAARQQQLAEKKAVKGAGPKMYGFFGDDAGTMGANTQRRSALDRGKQQIENHLGEKVTITKRPRLLEMTPDEVKAVNDGERTSRMGKKVGDMERVLGMDMSPTGAVKALQDEIDAGGNSPAESKRLADQIKAIQKAQTAADTVGALADAKAALEATATEHFPDSGGDAGAAIVGLRKVLRDVDTPMEQRADTTAGIKALETAERKFQLIQDKHSALKNEVDTVFADRKGEWSMRVQSAADMMKEEGWGLGRQLSAFRDYLLQGAKSRDNAKEKTAQTTEQAKTLRLRAATVGRVLEDEQNGRYGSAESAAESFKIQRDAQRAGAGDQQLDKAAKSLADSKTALIATRTERAQVLKAMDAYFSSRYMVAAEQLSDRAPGEMARTELMAMADAGRKALDKAGQIDRESGMEGAGSETTDTSARMLHFTSATKGRTERSLPIDVSRLVGWVRANRKDDAKAADKEGNSEHSNRSKDERFVDDLLDGIGTVINSGMVDVKAEPYVINQFGKREYFGKSASQHASVPNALQLETTTGFKFNKDAEGRAERANGDRGSDKRAEQEDMGGPDILDADWFGADPLEALDGRVSTRLDDRGPGSAGEYADRKTSAMIPKTVGEGRTTRAGERMAAIPSAKTLQDVNEELANKDDVTPTDSAKRLEPAAKGHIDERAELQFRSKRATDGISNEPRMSAMKMAEGRGAQLFPELLAELDSRPIAGDVRGATLDVDYGLERARMRMQAAERDFGTGNDNKLSGGVQYAFPLAHAFSYKNMAAFKADPQVSEAQFKEMTNLRRNVARVLLGDQVKPAEKVALAKAMFKDDMAQTTNVANVNERLALAAKGADKDSLALQGTRPQAKASKADLARYEADLAQAVKASKTAAPEVAAQRPKSQPQPAGQVKLEGSSPYLAKDQAKADRANKFIGRGSERSSTAAYARSFGEDANSGVYTSTDKVFVSAEGARTGRSSPDFRELERAMGAGATLITDTATDRARSYNVGERQVAEFLHDSGYREQSPGTWGRGKFNLQGQSAGRVNPTTVKLLSVLRERGIRIDAGALEHVPEQDRIDLVKKAMTVDLKSPVAAETAKVMSWMVVGGDLYNKVDAAIQGTTLEASILKRVNADPKRSMYTLPRKRKEVVREAVEQLLRTGLYKEYGRDGTMPQRFMAAVREAVTQVMAGLGLIKYKDLQGAADAFIQDIMSGRQKISRPVPEGHGVVNPYQMFQADQHAAGVVATIAAHKNFALTGSAAYAAQGTVYRPKDQPIHDVDFITSMSAQRAEAYFERNFPQAAHVRRFGGLGDFTSTYVVPPKGHTVTDVKVDNGVLTGFKVKDMAGKVVGGMSHVGGKESFTGVKGLVVDLIGDAEGTNAAHQTTMPVPAPWGDVDVAISPYAHAMSQKLLYGRDKDITDYVNFIPNRTAGVRNAQADGERVATMAEVEEAKAYVEKVLGAQVKTEFTTLTGYSGEWVETYNAIRIAMNAQPGVGQVARHEALHAFFSKFIKNNPRAMDAMKALVENRRVLARLETLLADHPAALEQLHDGEERLAYAYQFWEAGLLRLPHTSSAETTTQKIFAGMRKFFRRVFGMVSDSERAVEILSAFRDGKMADPGAAGEVIVKALDKGTWPLKTRRQFDGIVQRAAALTMPAESVLAVSDSKTAQQIGKMFYTNPGEEKDGTKAPGYLNARNVMMRRYENQYRQVLDGLDQQEMAEMATLMQREVPTGEIRDPAQRAAVAKLRTLFERFHRYLTDERGLRIGKIDQNYFPRVWNVEEINADPSAFHAMLLQDKYSARLDHMRDAQNAALDKQLADLEANADVAVDERVRSAIENVRWKENEDVAKGIAAHMTRFEGVTDEVAFGGMSAEEGIKPARNDGVLSPLFFSGEERSLTWLDPNDAEKFQEKDLLRTLSRYYRQGVRSAEYASRFGRDGHILAAKLMQADGEITLAGEKRLARGEFKDQAAMKKWVERQQRDVHHATGAMEGSLGANISDTWRKASNWTTVYQNVRLLPLALFSSFVDPLGIVARGGSMNEAFKTFTRGVQGVAREWGDMFRDEPADRKQDKWEQLAEHVGAIDKSIFANMLADEYASAYMEEGSRKINNALFKANGMEAWNRAMRIGAVQSAVNFIERHSKGESEHSARWIRELGLNKQVMKFDDEGKLITGKKDMMIFNPTMSEQEAEALTERIHMSINRYVEGAILSPNAAQRPSWASDPHFSMFFHLKQFAYSFHQTVMKRAMNEAKHGNVAPLGVFAWYLPVMMGADIAKGVLQGGGSLPNYMQGYDAADWLGHSIDRAGILGAGSIGLDALQDPTSLAGPMVQQLVSTLDTDPFTSLVKAGPLQPIYSQAVLH